MYFDSSLIVASHQLFTSPVQHVHAAPSRPPVLGG
jgi:hypothetical protein